MHVWSAVYVRIAKTCTCSCEFISESVVVLPYFGSVSGKGRELDVTRGKRKRKSRRDVNMVVKLQVPRFGIFPSRRRHIHLNTVYGFDTVLYRKLFSHRLT